MSKIYIRTYAYNAEKTLKRAVESVLSQTHSDFVYYLCDNGSTDNTGKIVEEYARQDNRIRPFYNKINRNFSETQECLKLPYQIGKEDFYCTLDADDEYLPSFFQEMLVFMDEYRLDLAACGSDFIDTAHGNRLMGKRILPRNMILQGQNFADFFPSYYSFMRTVWGKLHKGRVARNSIQNANTPGFPSIYGGDTYNMMREFGSADRVGILAKSLHRYYVSSKSVSYQFHPQRFETDKILHQTALDYLKPYGTISPNNEEFLLAIYMNALQDTWNVIFNANVSVSEKLNLLNDICMCEYTKQLAAIEHFGIYSGREREFERLRRTLFSSIVDWLLSFKEIADEQAKIYCEMGEFFCAASERADGWLCFRKLLISIQLEQGQLEESDKNIKELEELLPDDVDIANLRKEWRDKNTCLKNSEYPSI